MVLVRLLIPLAVFAFLIYILISQLRADKKEKEVKSSIIPQASLDDAIKDLKLKIAQAEVGAKAGIEEAEADLNYYKQKLENAIAFKEKSKNL